MRTRPGLTAATWRKSSYSNMDGGDCIEIAPDVPGVVPVRDSKRPHGPTVVVASTAWAAFVGAVKAEAL